MPVHYLPGKEHLTAIRKCITQLQSTCYAVCQDKFLDRLTAAAAQCQQDLISQVPGRSWRSRGQILALAL